MMSCQARTGEVISIFLGHVSETVGKATGDMLLLMKEYAIRETPRISLKIVTADKYDKWGSQCETH